VKLGQYLMPLQQQLASAGYFSAPSCGCGVELLVGCVAKFGRQIGCDPLTVIRFTTPLTPPLLLSTWHLLYTFSLAAVDAQGRCYLCL